MSEGLALSFRFLQHHPTVAAGVLERLGPEPVAAYLEHVPPELAGPVVARMLPFYAARILRVLEPGSAATLAKELPPSKGANVLRLLSPHRRERILNELTAEARFGLKVLLGYPQTAVGAWMDPQAPRLPHDALAAEAWDRLKLEARELERVVHVVDREDRLQGQVRTVKLFRADTEEAVSSFLESAPASVRARDDLASVRDLPAWSHGDPLPVIARDGRFIGVLRYQALRRGLAEDSQTGPSDLPLGNALLELMDTYWLGLSNMIEGSFDLLPAIRQGKSEEEKQ